MSDRGLMFTSTMVRAILAGRKSQTRRVVKPAIVEHIESIGGDGEEKAARDSINIHWGRPLGDDGKPDGREQWLLLSSEYPEEGCVPIGAGPAGRPGDKLYAKETWCRYADGSIGYLADMPQAEAEKIRWRPSLLIKRADARLWLRVTAVRLERLQDITEEDAEAEGVEPRAGAGQIARHRGSFERLWDELNGGHGRGFPWKANPWVWVIAFTRELQ